MVELHEFFVEGGNQERSHVLLHITEPSTAAERAKGYFFAVCEINNGTLEQIEELQKIVDDLESGYYETADTPEKDAFEIALESINRRGHQILKGGTSIVHCLVGTLREETLSLALHGQPTTRLFYAKQGELSAQDILADETNDRSDGQLFSAVIQGKLNPGDFLSGSTPHVSDFISDDRLKKLLPARSTRESAVHIQKVLGNLHNNLSYGGILIHLLPATQVPKTGKLPLHLKHNAHESMQALRQREERSTSVLSPTLWQQLGHTVKSLKSKKKEPRAAAPRPVEESNYRPREPRADGSFFALTLITLGRALVAGTMGLYTVLKKLVLLLGRGAVALLLIITNKGGQRELVIQSARLAIENKKQYVRNLPLVSKILFGLTLLLAIIFAGSIGYLSYRENRLARLQSYRQEVQAIADKKTAAEASLIYNDEAKAFALLQEATLLLNALPDNTREQKEQKAALAQEVDSSLMRLRKIHVTTPELIVDLGEYHGDAQATQLAILDEDLFAYGESDQRLYRLDLATKGVTAVAHDHIPNFIMATTPKEQDLIAFLTRDGRLAEYQKTAGTVAAKTIDLVPGAAFGALFVYNQRLYTIDQTRNQITKHARTQTGYDRGASWLRADETVDLGDAISLAIDGDLFVLKANGEVMKLVAGRRQTFEITGLDPKLREPAILWTYNDVKNLYILEPSQKRVVVLDKNGKLLAQYTASAWQNPTGMVVREEKGEVYILDTNKVYKFNLN